MINQVNCANDNVYGKPSSAGDELLMAFNARVERAMQSMDVGAIALGLAQLRVASAALLLQPRRAGQENK